MKVAVIGANGQLGSDICQSFSNTCEIVSLTHNDIEISDIDSVKKIIRSIKPSIVINTAAFHDVIKCEENPELSFQINGIGSLNLARLSNDLGYILVHYSTDYVFNGLKRTPYIEEDRENPLNIYAVTKLSGEHLIKNNCEKYYIIRISGIYGKVPCRAKGGNFITTMIKLSKEKPKVKVVNDEILTPTPTTEISNNTLILIQNANYGIYHMTSEGQCSWFDFAKVIFKTLGLATPLEPCSYEEFPSPVKRPRYSVLENQRLKMANVNYMKHWKEGLINFLKDNYNLCQ